MQSLFKWLSRRRARSGVFVIPADIKRALDAANLTVFQRHVVCANCLGAGDTCIWTLQSRVWSLQMRYDAAFNSHQQRITWVERLCSWLLYIRL